MTDAAKKRPRDPSRLAKLMVDIATGETEGEDKAAQAMGKTGGKARAEKMSPERRRCRRTREHAIVHWEAVVERARRLDR